MRDNRNKFRGGGNNNIPTQTSVHGREEYSKVAENTTQSLKSFARKMENIKKRLLPLEDFNSVIYQETLDAGAVQTTWIDNSSNLLFGNFL